MTTVLRSCLHLAARALPTLATTLVVALLPTAATAQETAARVAPPAAFAPATHASPLAPAPATTAAASGPMLETVAVGMRTVVPASSHVDANAVAAHRAAGRLGQSQILMIVGGSAVALGLITGDTAGQILVLGGAVVGLVGLYQYLKTH